MDRNNRRILVILHYFSLLTFMLGFYLIKNLGFSIPPLLLGLSGLIIMIMSSIYAFGKTGFWRRVHSPLRSLDEREIQSVYRGLRISYSVFVILCLLLIYVNIGLSITIFDALVAAMLIYLAHTLPAAYLAWTEKDI